MWSRRAVLGAATALPLIGLAGEGLSATPAAAGLASMTAQARPIGVEERRARIARLQALLVEQKIGALLMESGSSLEYFTGIKWHRSERTTAAVIPARGAVVVVTPAFEEPSVRETLQVEGDVRPWNEHESPFDRIAQALKDRGAPSGLLAVEPTTRFFIVDGVRQAGGGYEIVSGDALVRALRLIKSPGGAGLDADRQRRHPRRARVRAHAVSGRHALGRHRRPDG